MTKRLAPLLVLVLASCSTVTTVDLALLAASATVFEATATVNLAALSDGELAAESVASSRWLDRAGVVNAQLAAYATAVAAEIASRAASPE